MRLFTAIVPPREILDEVQRVVRSVNPPVVGGEPKRRGRPRLGGRGSRGAHAADRRQPLDSLPEARHQPTTPELDAPEVHEMYIPLAGFGNVTLGDSVKLADAIRPQVATWRRPELVFTGGGALEFQGDFSVWIKLDGDIDDLNTIGRGVPLVVQRMGFFVDRRQFRPWLSVGTITDATSAPYLERLVGALDAFRGEPWTVEHVYLMKWLPDVDGKRVFEEAERMPLA
jgi:2'-5' RNA ligase